MLLIQPLNHFHTYEIIKYVKCLLCYLTYLYLWLMLHLKLPLYSVFITMSVIEFVNLIAIMVLAYKELGL